MVKAITSDKNTTLAGIILIAIAVLHAIYAMVDGNPETVPNLQDVYAAVMGSGLLVAGDGGKSTTKSLRPQPGQTSKTG